MPLLAILSPMLSRKHGLRSILQLETIYKKRLNVLPLIKRRQSQLIGHASAQLP